MNIYRRFHLTSYHIGLLSIFCKFVRPIYPYSSRLCQWLKWSIHREYVYRGFSFIYATNVVQNDVIKWKHFPLYWPFVRGLRRSPVNSPHKGQWCGALMFSLICAWINDWVNNREAGDLRRHRALYDVIVMKCRVAVWFIHNYLF